MGKQKKIKLFFATETNQLGGDNEGAIISKFLKLM